MTLQIFQKGDGHHSKSMPSIPYIMHCSQRFRSIQARCASLHVHSIVMRHHQLVAQLEVCT